MDTELVHLTFRDDPPFNRDGIVALTSITVVDFAVVVDNPAKSSKSKVATWKPHWGTVPQWIAAITGLVVCTVLVITFVDNHIDKLFKTVDQKFEDIGTRFDTADKKADSTNQDLAALRERVGTVEGEMKILSGHVKLVQDPNKILGNIQADIQKATSPGNQPIPPTMLADYKKTVQALNPNSSSQYWKTVAAIINYQSKINQSSGAPDPLKVSHRCPGLTQGTGGNNVFEGPGIPISNCILDLDTTHNVLSNLVIKDSVVRYHGGPVALRDVLFVNCTFILDVSSTNPPAQPAILLTILNSPDQKEVKITTHS
ncbi:MAG: hypothetical protein WCD43_11850 [Candidatus Acidiferrales bacterium]